MIQRPIGNTIFTTCKIALGCVTFGREIDEAQSCRLLDYAVERGVTLLDTAEVYGGREMHSSEKILGRWLRATGMRTRIVLQTKTLAHKREDVAHAIQASLERLQTDRIDLYLLHRFNDDVPLAETMAPIAEAMRHGTVGAAGCSNLSASQLQSSLDASLHNGFPRFEVTQPGYNLVAREIEAEFLPLCRSENIGVVGYSPLGAGFLSGKYAGSIPQGSRFDVIPGHKDIYFRERNLEIVRQLKELADRTGIPMVRLAMAWALRNPDLTAVLIGARTVDHIDNALQALAMKLPEEHFRQMDDWSP